MYKGMHSNPSVEEEEDRGGKRGFYEVNEAAKVKMREGKHLKSVPHNVKRTFW